MTDFNESRTDACSRIVLLLHKLEELEAAGARSVAVEMESVVDGQETLIDHVGRKRILELCQEIHESCRKVSAQEMRVKLEEELRDAVMGKSRWYLQGQAADAARTDSQRDMGQHSRLGGDQLHRAIQLEAFGDCSNGGAFGRSADSASALHRANQFEAF